MESNTRPPLATGSRLGPYEIQAKIGEGGMGEVWKARDTRLNRSVALKISKTGFSDRFEREARAVAALSHQHICTLYDIGPNYLVMEMVEGETLAVRLSRERLSIAETLRFGAQIADALAEAHAKGITHRDLKPGNVMVTKAGIKVLDFGLAKIAATSGDTLTATSVVMGTPAYMAPEQLAGQPADARTDIYAMGLVLFEMATGKRLSQTPPAFHGIPEKVVHVISQCLEKDPQQRWQSASDLSKELAWCARSDATPIVALQRPSSKRWLWGSAVLIGSIALGAVASYFLTERPLPVFRVARFSIPQTGPTAITINGFGRDLVLTPDGSRLVYVGNGGTQLFVRSLDELNPMPIATGTLMAAPFVSPDGQWVGYLDSAFVMKKVGISGGVPVTLPGTGKGGAVWLPDNTIVYSTGGSGLLRISAADETANTPPETLTTPNTSAGEVAHLWPEMLPGGQAILFTITSQTGGLDSAQIAVLDLRTRKPKVVLRGGSSAHYIAGRVAGGRGGHLVYVAGGTLRAIPFDLTQLKTRGSAVPVVSRLLTDSLGGGDFTEAEDGTLMYVDAPDSAAGAARSLVWVDRAGHEEVAAPPDAYSHVSMSPDGARVAFTIENNGKRYISIWDVKRNIFTPLNFDLGRCICVPIWTPDGRIVFQAVVAGSPVSMWRMSADGSGKPERLIQNIYPQLATSITLDGKYLVFLEANPKTSTDVLQMALDDTRRVTPLFNSKSWEREGTVSPNGHWIAIECCTERQPDIYVSPYPNTQGSQWRVSIGGGRKPLWSRDSKELFFVGPNLAVMRVAVEATGAVWQVRNPSQLFDSRYAGNQYTDEYSYAISNDGQKFLMIKPPTTDLSGNPPKVIVVQHWNDELLKLAPAK